MFMHLFPETSITQELMRNVKKEKGERTEEVPTEEIEPEPG
jgi:hypothetical protein